MLPTKLQCLLAARLAPDGWTLHGDEARRGARKIRFFVADRITGALTAAVQAIVRADRDRFQQIGIVIVPTVAQMDRWRAARQAKQLPRVFFTSVEELQSPGRPTPAAPVMSFRATIVANTPVGPAPHLHYRLVFDAPELGDILPPQFFMMDVTARHTPLGARAVRRRRWRDAVDWSPQPLLKRPFGLCRAYLPHFPVDYLKRLALPAALAPALRTAKANRFDMLYKILPDGIGTPRLTQLTRGDKVHMIGPLGQPFDVRTLRAAGIEEIHVIGGGVGMAPLIQLVEALRFCSFRVKVFLGMATLESLRYRDELAATFGEKPRDAYIYLDDLLAAGVAPVDIFLSCDHELPRHVRRLPKANLFHGLVPEQYRRFLSCQPKRPAKALSREGEGPHNGNTQGSVDSEVLPHSRTQGFGSDAQNDSKNKIVAITCGPNRMMEVMTEVCQRAGVPLKVLLEKRMGCGFGVCFSCVQKVRRADGSDDYVRICREGPLFDAKDILWNNDSKPNLEACGCAPRS